MLELWAAQITEIFLKGGDVGIWEELGGEVGMDMIKVYCVKSSKNEYI